MVKVLEHEDPRQQCRNLLRLLHASDHLQAYVKLYLAMKEESDLQGLVDSIDELSAISLMQEMYISEPTGFRMFLKDFINYTCKRK